MCGEERGVGRERCERGERERGRFSLAPVVVEKERGEVVPGGCALGNEYTRTSSSEGKK